MKKIHKPTALVLALAIASGACQRSSSDNRSGSAPETNATTGHGKQAKWSMPEAMMQHMRNLEQDVRTLEATPEKDHAALAARIGAHTKQVISNCTMDGEAHDALHDWLMPFLLLNKEYAAAADEEAKSAKFVQIKDSLAAFHDRFE
jgi:hypothetical protein